MDFIKETLESLPEVTPLQVAATAGTLLVASKLASAYKNKPPAYVPLQGNPKNAKDSEIAGTSAENCAKVKRELDEHFNSGITKSYEWRIQQVLGFKRMLLENRQAIFDAAVKDIGRTEGEMMLMFNGYICDIQDHIGNLKSWMGKKKVYTPVWMQPASSFVKYEPLGTTLIIGAWNVPLFVTIIPALQALSAGNCAVLKFSESCVHQTTLFANLVPKYIDNNALRIVMGEVETSTYLLDLKWDLVFYTGGGHVGKIIAKKCAETLTPAVLELGGKSPVFVSEDIDYTMVSKKIIQAKYSNSGQVCVAPDYVLCTKATKAKLLPKLKEIIKQFYGEDPKKSSFYGGKLINERQFDRLEGYLKQGKIEIGGETDRESLYLAPTIMTDVPLDAALMNEEVFGPILIIVEVDNLDAGIKFVRNRPKPLACYTFSNNHAENERVLEETTSGGMCINDCLMQALNGFLPFGGVGPSGNGNYHGEFGFQTFSHKKGVVDKSLYGDAFIRYPPYMTMPWVQTIFDILMTKL